MANDALSSVERSSDQSTGTSSTEVQSFSEHSTSEIPSNRTKLSKQLEEQSIEKWDEGERVLLLGRNKEFRDAQKRLLRFSKINRPVLIKGESGTGKEEFAKSLYLLSDRSDQSFVSVNCAQYQGEDLLASELFGHKEGSFTGADYSREGLFESAEGGVLFLDEVGELSLRAQGMLLRAISEGKITRVGENESRRVNVRIVEATNRNLKQMVRDGEFREDLYYRLCHLKISLPSLRNRGRDWKLIADDYLDTLNSRHQSDKCLSDRAVQVLEDYSWPGNVRELRGIIDVGFCMAEQSVIEPRHFQFRMRDGSNFRRNQQDWKKTEVQMRYRKMVSEGEDFWDVVHAPYLDRDLNREQVKSIVERGLQEADGKYKSVLKIFNISEENYLKFMDFLRHHDLKPE